MARRVTSQNVEHRARQQNTVRACLIAIAANTSCPPTNAEGAVSNESAGGNCACAVKVMAKSSEMVRAGD